MATVANEFTHVAYVALHDELLEAVNKGVVLYKKGMRTQTQLNKVYKIASMHMGYLLF